MPKLLIVDDERSIRITLCAFLRDAGHEVASAESIAEAKTLLGDFQPQIVITDILLPDGSGIDLLEYIREITADCLVIVITGQPSMETAVQSLHLGAYDYIMKPITKEIVLHAANRASLLLRIKEERDELEAENQDHRSNLENLIVERTEKMRESQLLYQSLVDHLPLYIIRQDTRGRLTFSNLLFAKKIGLNSAALVGKPLSDFISDTTNALIQERMESVLKSALTIESKDPAEFRGLGQRLYSFIRTPILSEKGAIIGVQSIFQDITEKQNIENQLRKLAQAVEQSPVSIIITDKHGTIEFVNPKFTAVTGYSSEEVIGKKPSILKSGETPGEVYKQLWKTILLGKEWRGELHNKRKDGALYWETVSICPLRNSNNHITHFIGVKEDTTEKKLLERQFMRSQRLENIGSLASGIAHDLNNILTPIVMCAPLLKGELPQQDKLQLLTTIEESAKRAESIIKQLLMMGKTKEAAKAPIDLAALIKETEHIVKETFPKNITIKVHAPHSPVQIIGDPTQIHQILLNLVVNARDAMPEGGEISLSAIDVQIDQHYASMHKDAVPGAYVRIRVSDNGTGIPDAIQKKIFDPFFTTKDAEHGTGLGLTNVLGIIKNHQGFLALHSVVGEGTCFEINLPALTTDQSTSQAGEEETAPLGHGECILVVDDEPAIRNAMKRTLLDAGYTVLLAEDGIDAISQFTSFKETITLIISDWYMPNMNGDILCKTLRRISPKIPIVISTGAAIGQTALSIERTLEELKIGTLLHKPHTANALLKAIGQEITPST